MTRLRVAGSRSRWAVSAVEGTRAGEGAPPVLDRLADVIGTDAIRLGTVAFSASAKIASANASWVLYEAKDVAMYDR